jgi:hypothetical protein
MSSEITAGEAVGETATVASVGAEIEAVSIFEKIAQSLGLPPMVVEIGFIILTMIIILIVFIFLFTALRIRKEMISLNFKLGYIARLLKREIEGPEISPGPTKSPELKTKKEPPKEEPYKEEWKF